MAKIDLYDPKWVDMVFADRNKAYGAYKLRQGTSGRNIKSLVILLVAAALIGGFLAWRVIEQKRAEQQQAYMEALQLAKLQEQAKKERKKEQPKVQAKVEPKKVVQEVRATQKFTAPVIKKDAEVKEENQLKAQDELDNRAVGVVNQEGTKDRTVEAIRNDVAVNVPPPAPKEEVTQKIFDVVEQMPSFPGGTGALMQYLSSNIHYPVVAQENGVQGRVVVSFVVERDGSITDVKVVRSVDPSLDKEAVRVVKGMPNWNPGKQNGQAVRVKYNVPVSFKLQ